MKTIAKLLAALAAITGVVYVIATYGDKIVSWAKNLLASCPCCKCNGECECNCDEEDVAEDAPVEEVPTEEAPAEEVPAEEAPVIDEGEPVAEEADFEA